MALEMQSTDIYTTNHEHYQTLNDLKNIKTNMPNVPDLRNKLMFLSRIMFQDALYNQIGPDKISVVKFDYNEFVRIWKINLNLLAMWPDHEVRKFIEKYISKTVENQIEFDIFENKHIFQILYESEGHDIPSNYLNRVLSPVSFDDITYMKYTVPDIFKKTGRGEIEYKDAFSPTNPNSKRYGPDQLIEMVDDLFDNVMKVLDPYYDKESYLRVD